MSRQVPARAPGMPPSQPQARMVLTNNQNGNPAAPGQQLWGNSPASTVPRSGAYSLNTGLSNGVTGGSASLDMNEFPALGSAVGSQPQQQQPQLNAFRPLNPLSQGAIQHTQQTPQPFAQAARNGTQSPVPPGLQARPAGPPEAGDREDFPALPGASAKPVGTAPTKPQTLSTDMERYGMNGLLGVIRMESNDETTVAIGSDLRNLGLDFSPTDEPLSKTFSSPWIETSKHKTIPEFKLPRCYDVSSVVPQQQKVQNLTEETLFYMFYTMPRDSMQEAAAVELTNRNWRYHKELKLWLTKDPLSEPVQQTSQAESGIYVFFDPSTWEKVKREYVLYYPDIA